MTRETTIKVDYGTHICDSVWIMAEDIYCPACGVKACWVERGPGDYYVGPQYICVECGGQWNLPNGVEDASKYKYDKQRLAQLRECK